MASIRAIRPRLPDQGAYVVDPLSAPQGATHGSNQNRIRRLPESGLKCGSRQIPAQNLKINSLL
jgi:hypothetical protein